MLLLLLLAAFDETRFVGVWYELASEPAFFTKGCHATTSTWTLLDHGEYEVRNSCRKGGFDGDLSGITAKAWAPNAAEPAKLKIQFVWPFQRDFWIVAYDPDYQWAITSDQKKVWLFARKPDPSLLADLTKRAQALNYDVSRLRPTPQR